MSHQQALAQVTAQAIFSQPHMFMHAEYQPSSLEASMESMAQDPSFIADATTCQQVIMATIGGNMDRSRSKGVSIREVTTNVHISIDLSRRRLSTLIDGQITEIIYKGQDAGKHSSNGFCM